MPTLWLYITTPRFMSHKHQKLSFEGKLSSRFIMEDLMKQRRVRFSDLLQAQDDHGDANSTRERALPRQPDVSFKGDSTGQRWLRKQFSSQMSKDYNDSDGEFMTSIAAAAFAIFSLDEARSQHENRTKSHAPLEKHPSGRVTRRLSNKDLKNPGDVSMRRSAGQDLKAPNEPSRSFSRSSLTRYNSKETKANAWEKSQLEKIKKRSEKMKSAIQGWENEKKMKAKLSMDKKKNPTRSIWVSCEVVASANVDDVPVEDAPFSSLGVDEANGAKRQIDVTKERNMQHYKMKIASIDQIAGGARSQVDEKRRKEEMVVKEKAKRIRSTGRIPSSCFCF